MNKIERKRKKATMREKIAFQNAMRKQRKVELAKRSLSLIEYLKQKDYDLPSSPISDECGYEYRDAYLSGMPVMNRGWAGR